MQKTKENNSQNTFWTTVGVVMCLVVLFFIGFGAKIGTYERTAVNNPTVNYEGGTQYAGQSEQISINGISQVRTINNPNQVIDILMNGQDNIITISKNTFVSSISLNGIDNVVNLCKGIHNPEVRENGIGNKINYVNC